MIILYPLFLLLFSPCEATTPHNNMPTKQNQGSSTDQPMANNMAPPMPGFGTVIRQGLENGNIVGVEHRVRWLFQKGDEGKVNMMTNNNFKKNPKNPSN